MRLERIHRLRANPEEVPAFMPLLLAIPATRDSLEECSSNCDYDYV